MFISTLREIARRKILKYGTPLTVTRCVKFRSSSGRRFEIPVSRTVWFVIHPLGEGRVQLTCPWNAELAAGRDRVHFCGAVYKVKTVMGHLNDGLVVTVVCEAERV